MILNWERIPSCAPIHAHVARMATFASRRGQRRGLRAARGQSHGGTTGDSGLQCGVDSDREPNGTIATPTVISDAGRHHSDRRGAVPRDRHRHLSVDRRHDRRVSSRRRELQRGQRSARVSNLLNSTGLVIRSATRVGNDPGHLRIDFENLASGAYYARVQPMGAGFRTNYQVTFLVTAGPLPP